MVEHTDPGYKKEIGRAGRDALISDCCLYLSPEDVPVLEGFARADVSDCFPGLRFVDLSQMFQDDPAEVADCRIHRRA